MQIRLINESVYHCHMIVGVKMTIMSRVDVSNELTESVVESFLRQSLYKYNFSYFRLIRPSYRYQKKSFIQTCKTPHKKNHSRKIKRKYWKLSNHLSKFSENASAQSLFYISYFSYTISIKISIVAAMIKYK